MLRSTEVFVKSASQEIVDSVALEARFHSRETLEEVMSVTLRVLYCVLELLFVSFIMPLMVELRLLRASS